MTTLNLREFLRCAALGALAFPRLGKSNPSGFQALEPASAKATAGKNSKPNVLFILADDMRPDCIGACGNPHIQTPHLDALVGRGMVFTRTYVQGANSGEVCTPSRTMILSGRSVFHFGGGGYAKPNKGTEVLWANAMRAGGYETFHLGMPGR